jgi:hypothetical protein
MSTSKDLLVLLCIMNSDRKPTDCWLALKTTNYYTAFDRNKSYEFVQNTIEVLHAMQS